MAGETAESLAADSISFKNIDSKYSSTLLTHDIEIYELADKYRGDYMFSIPSLQVYYSSLMNI